jgi:hypothetical protein
VTASVDGYVPRKCFAQRRVETFFIAAHAATTKCDQVEQSGRVLCLKVKGAAMHSLMHSLHGGILVSWLACNVPKPLCGKVCTKDLEFPMIVSAKARILEDGFAHIVPGSNRN